MGFLAFLYGLVCYLIFLASLLYAIGFVGNFVVPKTIDSGAEGPLGQALATNLALMGLWAVTHSVMARRWFKRWWTRFVPESVERSTYVLVASVLLFLLYFNWQPIKTTVWSVESSVGRGVIWAIFAVAWLLVVVVSFMIDHFDTFGIRQVLLRLKGREYTEVPFQKPAFYKHLRHPLNLAFLVAFWATPDMTGGHLLFAIVITVFTLIAVGWEENDLVHRYGQAYADYQKRVPKWIPGRGSG